VVVVAALVVAGLFLSGAVNLGGKTIKYTDVAPVDQQAQIQSGNIDGGVSWEPYVSDSILAGTAHALVWSGDIWPDHPCCVVVADGDFLNSNPDAVNRVLKAHIEANLWIADAIANKETNPTNYTLLLQIGASFSGRSTEVVDSSLQHMKLTYNITSESVAYFKQFTEDYVDAGLIQSNRVSDVNSFVNGLIDATHLEAAANIQPVDDGFTPITVRIGYLQGDLHQFARVVAENIEVGGGKSLFATYGIQTALPDGATVGGYNNGGAVMTAFASSENLIDMAYLGAPPVLLNHANQGIDVKILSLANTEGSALVISGDRSIEDLDGLVIGQPGSSSIQYLLLVAIADKYGYDLVRG
jgi:NitT/TauT family transport system substrate-binding protein